MLTQVADNYAKHRISSSSPRRDLLATALVVKCCMILLMSTASTLARKYHFLHDPAGNDVDDVLRFPLRADAEATCFSLKGTFCNCGWDCSWEMHGDATSSCYERGLKTPENALLQRHVYPFLLEPLTRWDAARFLKRAMVPQITQPHLEDCTGKRKQECAQAAYVVSEQAHAFFPFFPTLIQYTADQLLFLPQFILPTTCEQVMTLAALIVNLVAGLWATLALYQLSVLCLPDQLWAKRVTLLFILNPAQVFFVSSYSESVFAALIFSGCWAWASKSEIAPLIASLCWYLATTTRSNGAIYIGFILLSMIGSLFATRDSQARLTGFLVKFANVYVICRALYDHNQEGIAQHCETNSTLQPDWCNTALTSSTFSLYQFVQEKYWNVGFFRYYEMKQVPNFLLASPILILSLQGSIDWVIYNWKVRAHPLTIPGISSWFLDVCKGFATGDNAFGHYAVLGASALVGLTVAHVQISTRLICSACPALYWAMASQVWGGNGNSSVVGDSILAYCLLYMLLGAILHSCWYPWT